jgi:hypothetical protein
MGRMTHCALEVPFQEIAHCAFESTIDGMTHCASWRDDIVYDSLSVRAIHIRIDSLCLCVADGMDDSQCG